MEPRPVKLQRDIERRYPGIWDIVSHVRNDKGNKAKGIKDWSDWCYLPVAAWFAIVEKVQKDNGDALSIPVAQQITAVGTWRLGKGIYRFDSDLYSELIDTPVSDNLPVEIFLRLPEYCMYVETPILFFKGELMYGFYAFLEEDYQDGTPELRLLFDLERTHYPFILPIPVGGDFKTEFNKIYQSEEMISDALEKGYFKGATMEDIFLETQLMRNLATRSLSLLLYLCSNEPDYGDRMPPVHAAPKKVKSGEKWFAAPGITTWEVGVRIGAAIRKYRQQAPEREGGEPTDGHHTPKRPHMRRAHWHGFWMGPRKEPEKMKFVLHWIPPIPVKMLGDDSPTVIRPVKK